MAIDDELVGLDPYDLMDREAARIEVWGRGLDAAAWQQPSACAGWTRHDVLAHLVADETYFHAGLDHRVAAFMAEQFGRGATDLHSFNQLGVDDRRGVPTAQLLDEWVAADARTRAGMRALDGRDVDTSIGDYPARWQTFHLASELATHADDLGIPVTEDEVAERLAWRTRFSCFALAETKPGVTARREGDRVVVTGTDGRIIDVDEATFVAAVAGRAPADADLDDEARALLSTMP